MRWKMYIMCLFYVSFTMLAWVRESAIDEAWCSQSDAFSVTNTNFSHENFSFLSFSDCGVT